MELTLSFLTADQSSELLGIKDELFNLRKDYELLDASRTLYLYGPGEWQRTFPESHKDLQGLERQIERLQARQRLLESPVPDGADAPSPSMEILPSDSKPASPAAIIMTTVGVLFAAAALDGCLAMRS